jgi:hypothetical protein
MLFCIYIANIHIIIDIYEINLLHAFADLIVKSGVVKSAGRRAIPIGD